MSTTETEVKKSEIAKGLQVRKFNGEIDKTPEEKNKEKKTIIKFLYDRIVFPWSRTGKDHEEKEVLGAVPSLSEVMSYAQAQGWTTEFKLDSENNPEGPCIVGFLVDGINGYLNRTARVQAENTPESAFEKSIQSFMSKTGLNKEQAMAMFAKLMAGETK